MIDNQPGLALMKVLSHRQGWLASLSDMCVTMRGRSTDTHTHFLLSFYQGEAAEQDGKTEGERERRATEGEEGPDQ